MNAGPGQAVRCLGLTLLCLVQRLLPTEAQILGEVDGDGGGLGTAADDVENSERTRAAALSCRSRRRTCEIATGQAAYLVQLIFQTVAVARCVILLRPKETCGPSCQQRRERTRLVSASPHTERETLQSQLSCSRKRCTHRNQAPCLLRVDGKSGVVFLWSCAASVPASAFCSLRAWLHLQREELSQ